MLNHWDNLDRTRVYPGSSIWDWASLTANIKQIYIVYPRVNASIGINGTVLNNVSADPLIVTHEYLVKVAALAEALSPYKDIVIWRAFIYVYDSKDRAREAYNFASGRLTWNYILTSK